MDCSAPAHQEHPAPAHARVSRDSFASMASTLTGGSSEQILCPSAAAASEDSGKHHQPPLVGSSLCSLGKFRDATDILRAATDLASVNGLVAILPHFEETPPTTVHPEASSYARDHAISACGRISGDGFHFTQLGDLVIWNAVGHGSTHSAGLTYVSPSHSLCADLVVGMHSPATLCHQPAFDDTVIAMFAMMCHCIAVPKNRSLLMDHDPEIKPLTPRELQVLRASSQGATAKHVSELIGISERTVHAHVAQLLVKLQCATKAQAILRATRIGLI